MCMSFFHIKLVDGQKKIEISEFFIKNKCNQIAWKKIDKLALLIKLKVINVASKYYF